MEIFQQDNGGENEDEKDFEDKLSVDTPTEKSKSVEDDLPDQEEIRSHLSQIIFNPTHLR